MVIHTMFQVTVKDLLEEEEHKGSKFRQGRSINASTRVGTLSAEQWVLQMGFKQRNDRVTSVLHLT